LYGVAQRVNATKGRRHPEPSEGPRSCTRDFGVHIRRNLSEPPRICEVSRRLRDSGWHAGL